MSAVAAAGFFFFFFFLHMVAKNLNDCVECAPPELDDAARREDAEKKMMLCSL